VKQLFLTKEEEKILDGEAGVAKEWALKLLAKCGEAFGAENLVDISSAVIPWTPGTKSVFPEDVWEHLLETGFTVPTYSSSQTVDNELWREMGTSEDKYRAQKEMNDKANDVGCALLGTCTPYAVGYCPAFGSHVSSEESSCIPYLNSVFGARTHRESSFTHLASALVGKTPDAGFHKTGNRFGDVLVEVEADISEVADYHALGYYVGNHIGLEIPVFTGLKGPQMDELKSLGAAMATSGAVGMYHIVGATPEAPTLDAAFRGEKPKDKISVGEKEIAEAADNLSTIGSDKFDFIMLGCPHYSINQIAEVAALLKGKKIHRSTELWIFTSEPIRGEDP
jgi:predicted aconitase